MRLGLGLTAMLAGIAATHAAEVTIRNDSLDDFGTANIVWGFASGEKAASWLTSPCQGAVRAVQIFWRSPTGTTGQQIHAAIELFASGTFPTPGALLATIGGPVLTDGVLNEWRYLDKNNTIPLNVPIAQDETFVVAFAFDVAPAPFEDPSVVRDNDGPMPNRNAIFAIPGGWIGAPAAGVNGDWVIRAVVDCTAAPQQADVGVGLASAPKYYVAGDALSYTIVVNNAGPAAASSTSVVDIFPAAFGGAAWTCTASGGASCAANGSGNITEIVSLPAGGEVVFDVVGTVAPGTTGTLSNTVTAVVGGGITDPVGKNNTVTLDTLPDTDTIFADGFEPSPPP